MIREMLYPTKTNSGKAFCEASLCRARCSSKETLRETPYPIRGQRPPRAGARSTRSPRVPPVLHVFGRPAEDVQGRWLVPGKNKQGGRPAGVPEHLQRSVLPESVRRAWVPRIRPGVHPRQELRPVRRLRRQAEEGLSQLLPAREVHPRRVVPREMHRPGPVHNRLHDRARGRLLEPAGEGLHVQPVFLPLQAQALQVLHLLPHVLSGEDPERERRPLP
jgi:hypothetical protein